MNVILIKKDNAFQRENVLQADEESPTIGI